MLFQPFSLLLSLLFLLSPTIAQSPGLNSLINCGPTYPKDPTLQSSIAKNAMFNCLTSLINEKSPFNHRQFTGIQCMRTWHLFTKSPGKTNFFPNNGGCMVGCYSCMKNAIVKGQTHGYCSYYPDTKRSPDAFCVVGYHPN
ncbi:hypothetical protein BDD12DRAFT_830155 [Trichophaea hybrida]|nr:hypothetical protein BDD12DRAFT_830155 [Trichophaea hybrida]